MNGYDKSGCHLNPKVGLRPVKAFLRSNSFHHSAHRAWSFRMTLVERFKKRCHIATLFSLILLSGCIKDPATSGPKPGEAENNASAIVPPKTIAGGLAVPADVRTNLGITFVKVEQRKVEDTLRVPGAFELLPGARHEYHALLAGHVRLAVTQFQPVQKGDLLFSLDSPDWRRVQHEAVEAEGEIKIADAALEVAQTRLGEARTSATLANERVQSLAAVKVRKADLEADAAALNSSLLRLQAEIDAASAAHDEAHEHYLSRLNTLSSIASRSVDELLAPGKDGGPAWRDITTLEIRAKAAGIVEIVSANEGAWLEGNTHAVTVLDPAALVFQGKAPQSELTGLRDGMACRIVPPQGGDDATGGITGTMQIGLTAHSEDRTISLFVKPDSVAPWVKSGVSAYLEIPREDAPTELAIPSASLVQEGLDTIFFRRHPKDPDRVLPVKADLGASDGRWVVVRSGVKEGDEVVLDGAYALKLAGGSNKAPEGYHYHADGQLHKNH